MLSNRTSSKFLLSLAILLLATMATSIFAQEEKSTAEVYNAALQHQKDGDIASATLEYKLVLETDPNYLDAYLNLGAIYFEQKEFNQALGMFMTASEKDPQNFDAFANIGRVEYKLKRYSQAVEAYTKALVINPADGVVQGELGKTYYNQKKFSDAITAYDKCHTAGSGSYKTYYYHGKACQKSGQDNKAIASLKESLKLKASNYTAQSSIGQIYLSQEKFQKAASAFKTALKINPKKYLAAYNYASAKESLDPDAIDANVKNWQEFLRIAKGNPKARSNIEYIKDHIVQLKDRKAKLELQ